MKNRKFAVIASVVLTMATLMSFAGCGCSLRPTLPSTQVRTEVPIETPTEASTEVPTEPAPTEPEWQPGLSKADYVEAAYSLLSKGDEVEVVGKTAHYFVIAGENYNLLVNEDYIRLDREDTFESQTAFSRYNRPVFASVYMRNEPITRFPTNAKLTVLEAKNGWVFVEWFDGKEYMNGYMRAEDISDDWINVGGGSSSGSSTPDDGTDVDVDSLSATSQQGALALLGTYYGPEMEAGFETCKGIVLADEVEAYITVFNHGAEMKVVEYDDGFCTIYLANGLTAKVRRELVKLESDSEEEFFSGYARSGAVVFKEYQQRNEYKKLNFNDKVEVLYKLPALTYEGEEIYAVSIDGKVMYMMISAVSERWQQPASSGSSSGSEIADVWTPPVL